MRYDLVVNTFLKDALLKKHLFLHEGGFMYRPLVDVVDVAMAHIVCIDAPAAKVAGRVLNVVQDNYQIKDLAETVAEAVRPVVGEIAITSVPATGRIRDYRASNTRMTEATGFTPLRTPCDSVASILEHMGEVDVQELLHPRHYNLRWMQILTEMHELQKSYDRVF
jgi:nucleoside-diphosphate-sugar epimerase